MALVATALSAQFKAKAAQLYAGSGDFASVDKYWYLAVFKDYVENNAQVNVSYAGTIPGPPPVSDPVVVGTGKLKVPGLSAGATTKAVVATITSASNMAGWLSAIATDCGLAAQCVLDSPLAATTVSIVFPPPGKSESNLSKDDDHGKIWDDVASWLVDMVKNAVIAFGPGSNTTSGSTGVVTQVSIV